MPTPRSTIYLHRNYGAKVPVGYVTWGGDVYRDGIGGPDYFGFSTEGGILYKVSTDGGFTLAGTMTFFGDVYSGQRRIGGVSPIGVVSNLVGPVGGVYPLPFVPPPVPGAPMFPPLPNPIVNVVKGGAALLILFYSW